jgi:hypothetical protein
MLIEREGALALQVPILKDAGSGDAQRQANKEKRSSTRLARRLPITVVSVDALGQSFREDTLTVSVNCHGCKYRTKHYVAKGSAVTIEAPGSGLIGSLYTVPGRVAWVQRPRHLNEDFEIGLAFDVPRNIWGIAVPPEDWVPYSEETKAAAPTPEPIAAVPVKSEAPASVLPVRGAQEQTTESIAIADIVPEARNQEIADLVKKSLEASLEPISRSVIENSMKELAYPLAAMIADQVCRDVVEKLDARIKTVVEELAGVRESTADKPTRRSRRQQKPKKKS